MLRRNPKPMLAVVATYAGIISPSLRKAPQGNAEPWPCRETISAHNPAPSMISTRQAGKEKSGNGRGKPVSRPQQITDFPDGEIELRLTLTSTVEVLPWILGWQTHAKVLEPAAFVELVTNTVRDMGDVYTRTPSSVTAPAAPLVAPPHHSSPPMR